MRHTFKLEGIRINPLIPDTLYNTPNEERSQEELDEWWIKPYILISEFSAESWEERYHRLKEFNWSDEKIGTKEEYITQIKERRERWLQEYPNGFCYNVYCLNGGAWDRPTSYKSYATIEEALAVAINLK